MQKWYISILSMAKQWGISTTFYHGGVDPFPPCIVSLGEALLQIGQGLAEIFSACRILFYIVQLPTLGDGPMKLRAFSVRGIDHGVYSSTSNPSCSGTNAFFAWTVINPNREVVSLLHGGLNILVLSGKPAFPATTVFYQ